MREFELWKQCNVCWPITVRTRGSAATILGRLTVLSEVDTAALADLAARAMKMQVNNHDGEVVVSLDEGMVYVRPEVWKR